MNPPREGLSPSYDELYGGQGVWDVHIYWKPNNLDEKAYARKLHQAIRREFPELHVKRFWEVPIGPHPTPMFEVNMFNAAQLGAIFNYLVENRGPLRYVCWWRVTALVWLTAVFSSTQTRAGRPATTRHVRRGSDRRLRSTRTLCGKSTRRTGSHQSKPEDDLR